MPWSRSGGFPQYVISLGTFPNIARHSNKQVVAIQTTEYYFQLMQWNSSRTDWPASSYLRFDFQGVFDFSLNDNTNLHQTVWYPFTPNTLPRLYKYWYPAWSDDFSKCFFNMLEHCISIINYIINYVARAAFACMTQSHITSFKMWQMRQLGKSNSFINLVNFQMSNCSFGLCITVD